METLIVGASTEESIGYHIGENLKSQGHKVNYANRSGRLSAVIAGDVCQPMYVKRLLTITKPALVVHAAGGSFLDPKPLGKIEKSGAMRRHIEAKSAGTIQLLNAAARIGTVRYFIALGGRESFEDRKMVAYQVGNAALWAAIQFANRHYPQCKHHYLDLPIVIGTSNAEGLVRAGAHTTNEQSWAIPITKVLEIFDHILAGEELPERIVL